MAGQRLGATVEFCSFMRASIIHRYFGSPASHLRSVACLEGLSYLLLLSYLQLLSYLLLKMSFLPLVNPIAIPLFKHS